MQKAGSGIAVISDLWVVRSGSEHLGVWLHFRIRLCITAMIVTSSTILADIARSRCQRTLMSLRHMQNSYEQEVCSDFHNRNVA